MFPTLVLLRVYATMCAILDICYVVRMIRYYQENPEMIHWKRVKRILGYLKGTMDYPLYYQGKILCLVRYSDVD